MKKIIWNDKAREYIRGLSISTKREIGVLLMMLQKRVNLGLPQSKVMKTIHQNAYELRVKDGAGVYRVIYVLATADKILIPHAFSKKSRKTPLKEVSTSIRRLKEMLNEIK